MHPRSPAGVLLLASGALLFACQSDGTGPEQIPASPEGVHARIASVPQLCASETYTLLAGRSIDAGEVVIGNDEEYVYVSLFSEDGWEMTSSHVAAATDPDLLPMQGGRMVPGQFADGARHDPALTAVHYAIPLPASDGELVVAAHADVVRGDDSEGAWVEGESRDDRGWASFARYAIASCDDGSTVIGADGGEIANDNMTLVIPPDALDSDVEITVEPIAENDLPDGVLPGTAFDFGPDGQQFDAPLLLTIHYNDTGLTLADEQNVAIHLLRDDGTLLRLPTTVDTDANTASAEVMHFSVYAVALPSSKLELRVGTLGAPHYSNGSVWAGFELEHRVMVWNLGSTPIPGSEVQVEFTAEGLVAPFGLAYSTGLCTMTMPTATSYHFTCTMPNFDIQPGTAATLAFDFTTASGGAGTTFDVSASFAYDIWSASTATVSTDIVEPPDEADLFVFLDAPEEATVGSPVAFNAHVVNHGPGPSPGASLEIELVGDVAVEEAALPADCSWQLSGANVLVTCPVRALVPGFGESRTITITPLSAGEIHVTATVVGSATDPNTGNNVDHALLVANTSP